MGLFSGLFKTSDSSRFEDIYNYDIPALLKQSTFKGSREEEGMTYFAHECILNPVFLNAFNTLRMEVRYEGTEIQPDNYIELRFLSRGKALSKQQIEHVVDAVLQGCNDNTPFTKNSVPAFKAGVVDYLSIDLNDDIFVSIKNDPIDGVYVNLHILYSDLVQLAQEQKSK